MGDGHVNEGGHRQTRSHARDTAMKRHGRNTKRTYEQPSQTLANAQREKRTHGDAVLGGGRIGGWTSATSATNMHVCCAYCAHM
eukprot:273828-Chlamydomonas_euryale.AAC.7